MKRTVLKPSRRRLFRSTWDVDIFYNRFLHGMLGFFLLGLVLLLVMQVFHAPEATAVIPASCERYNPTTRNGVLLHPGEAPPCSAPVK